MTNIIEVIKEYFQTKLDDEPKSPLHVGEVMNCWMYLTIMDESSVYLEIGINTTTDDEVKHILMESLEQCQTQANRVRDFLINEGIPLPPTSEQRPKSNPNEIPLGAKLTDEEIINGLSIKTVTAIMQCATTISQAVRNDVAGLFTHALLEKMKFGMNLKEAMKKRGWIKVPPYYYPPGKTNN
ncbi:DUF3231 family protein [Bacillus kwashiorkori]|uniref:DUF3231 family protein n=1 Tax=Bacillus kwashiorkori TaxID=1522318 RepID=UPI0007839CA6|nr:DUF3231 family protein [Bacillus kwashiorkori]